MSTQQAIHYVPNGEVLGIKLVETKNTHQSHPSASFQMSMWSLLTRGLVSPSPWRERELRWRLKFMNPLSPSIIALW